MAVPELSKIRQQFRRPRVEDLEGAVRGAFERIVPRVSEGDSIAITAGSRGIDRIDRIVAALVEALERRGARPFIVPAMGSHGGATAEGQAEVLAGYGITEEDVGAPVRSSMEVVEITPEDARARVFMDRHAYESDGVVLLNRVKPHTDFRGRYESGLVKMSVMGLGKHAQVREIHTRQVFGLRELIPETAGHIFETGQILGGLALLENAYDELMRVEGLRTEEILEEEPGLLDEARAHMPHLPVEDIDLLIVDRIGKDVSGTGLDTNVIGRMYIDGESEPESPSVGAIALSDLTAETHGNSVGMGLADVITRRLFEKIDFEATYENTVTSTFLERGKMPVVAPNDRAAAEAALRSVGPIDGTPRVVRILDTLHLDRAWVSSSVLAELETSSGSGDEAGSGGPGEVVVHGPRAPFTDEGDLVPF